MIFICLFSGLFQTTPLFAQENNRPKVGLVLSGGGAKGFAHIGVLQVLEEAGIPIDIIVGTSIGSIVGGFYSIGYSADEIEKITKAQNWSRLLTDEIPRKYLSPHDKANKQRYLLTLPANENNKPLLPQGIIRGHNILNLFCGLAGNVPQNADFSEFPISFAGIGCNLETGEEVILNKGFLPKAIFSSMAIPGVFYPVEYGGNLLIDGGVANNFPIDVAKNMGADIIIGVDIRHEFYNRKEIKSINEVANQLISFLDKNNNEDSCDILIKPDLKGFSISSFYSEAVDSLIKRGKAATNEVLPQIVEIKKQFDLKREPKTDSLTMPSAWQITQIKIKGKYGLPKDFIIKNLQLNIPGNFSKREIKNAIDRLYGYGGFNYVYYDIQENPGGKTLEIHVQEKEVAKLNLGFNINTMDAAEVMLNFTRKNFERFLGILSVGTKVSANPEFNILAEIHKKYLPNFGFQMKGKYQNLDIQYDRNRSYNTKIGHILADIYLYQQFKRKLRVGIGGREEFYNGNIFPVNPGGQEINPLQKKDFISSIYGFISLDNLDDFYFPEKGLRVFSEFSVEKDFGSAYNHYYSFLFRSKKAFPISKRVTGLAKLQSRFINTNDTLSFKSTMIGGEHFASYYDFHFPFEGMSPATRAKQISILPSAGLRVRLFENHYITLAGNGLLHFDQWKNFDTPDMIWGGSLKYSIKTALGPMEGSVGYSTFNHNMAFAANFGYWF